MLAWPRHMEWFSWRLGPPCLALGPTRGAVDDAPAVWVFKPVSTARGAHRSELRGHDRLHDRAPAASVLCPEAERVTGNRGPADCIVFHCPADCRAAVGTSIRPIRPAARAADRS